MAPERRARVWAGGVTALLAIGAAAVTADAAAPSPAASAIGNESVRSIAVSPAYDHTGTVVAVSSAAGCSSDCTHLWVTHDRGSSWERRAARGWQPGTPAIGVTADGREVLFSAGTSALQRSDDGGDTWKTAGPAGTVTVSPGFTQDGAVAIAGGTAHDYVVDVHGAGQVDGSGGSLVDTSFMYSPSFPPASGNFPPALLGALDAHTGAEFVLRCTARLACSSPVPLVPAQKMPSGLTLVASPAYASDGTLFANAVQSLYKSTDGGASFVPVTLGQPGAIATATSAVALDPGYRENGADRVAYAAVLQLFKDPRRPTSGGVYRTADGGRTWSVLGSPSPLDAGATALAVAPDGRIFAGFIQSAGSTAGLLCWYRASWAAACGGTRVAGSAASPCPQCASAAAPLQGGAAASVPSDAAGAGSAASAQSAGPGGASLVGAAQRAGAGPNTLAITALAIAAGLGVTAAVSFLVRRRRTGTGRETR